MLLLPQGGGGHGRADNIHQFQGGGNGLLLPLSANGRGNLGGVALLAVVMENALQLLIGPGIDHGGSGKGIGIVHAHIQRGIRHIGKTPASIIQLGGRNAQIQQNAVHAINMQLL